jgi:hypothetical protein
MGGRSSFSFLLHERMQSRHRLQAYAGLRARDGKGRGSMAAQQSAVFRVPAGGCGLNIACTVRSVASTAHATLRQISARVCACARKAPGPALLAHHLRQVADALARATGGKNAGGKTIGLLGWQGLAGAAGAQKLPRADATLLAPMLGACMIALPHVPWSTLSARAEAGGAALAHRLHRHGSPRQLMPQPASHTRLVAHGFRATKKWIKGLPAHQEGHWIGTEWSLQH